MNVEKIKSIQIKQQAVMYVKFVQTNHRKPRLNLNDKEETHIYHWYEDFIKKDKNFENNEEILQILQKVTTVKHVKKLPHKKRQDKYNAYIAFTQEHNKLPSSSSNDDNERKLSKWYYRISYSNKGDEILKNLKENVPLLVKKNTIDDEVDKYIEWCNKYNSLPSGYNARDDEEKYLARWFSLFKLKSQYKKHEKQGQRLQHFMEEFEKKILDEIK